MFAYTRTVDKTYNPHLLKKNIINEFNAEITCALKCIKEKMY